ncbi:hypothetical protein GCM10010885_03280 [Alicyclobacillus cellulosilyticus]|uniref:Uncharacterized protein n=1 Tax=Alicyclobacillus cellulosilyticus TaxID=1003997 RepID=A0A917K334_9BACL|nr:hypothetical protein [Alicyclobacillus cellulosilyticus]GGI97039.1 hypothetical protein GCM10010885_03280 [Alicyclobacillus cellulosilyticus]
MRTLQVLFRVFRLVATVYGVWQMLSRGKWLRAAWAVLRHLRQAPDRDARRTAEFIAVSGGEPAIYRRRGWRRVGARRARAEV